MWLTMRRIRREQKDTLAYAYHNVLHFFSGCSAREKTVEIYKRHSNGSYLIASTVTVGERYDHRRGDRVEDGVTKDEAERTDKPTEIAIGGSGAVRVRDRRR